MNMNGLSDSVFMSVLMYLCLWIALSKCPSCFTCSQLAFCAPVWRKGVGGTGDINPEADGLGAGRAPGAVLLLVCAAV